MTDEQLDKRRKEVVGSVVGSIVVVVVIVALFGVVGGLLAFFLICGFARWGAAAYRAVRRR